MVSNGWHDELYFLPGIELLDGAAVPSSTAVTDANLGIAKILAWARSAVPRVACT